MESLGFLINGFSTALQPTNLLFALMGAIMGTLVGVLPGLGPAAGTAILIPVTFVLEPTPAIHYAGRHLLRGDVRGYDYQRADQHPRRSSLGHHLSGGVRDGQEGQGGSSPGHRGNRIVRGRQRGDLGPGARWPFLLPIWPSSSAPQSSSP